MNKTSAFTIFTLTLSTMISSASFAAESPEIPKFSNGSEVSCLATHVVGNNRNGVTAQPVEIFYRLDSGLYENAYFRKVVTLGNYSYDGTCGRETCRLSIRDLRTNTVSTLSAAYSKLNNNKAQIQISNFGEDLILTLACTLTK